MCPQLGIKQASFVEQPGGEAEVASLALTECWFGRAKIVIQATNMDAFQNVPTASQGRVELSIAKKDHVAAEDFVASLHDNDNVPAETSRA